MQKELLSPVKRLEDETGDSEMPKFNHNEVFFDIVDEQSLDQTRWQTDEKVNIAKEANTKTTGCNCSRQLLEYGNKNGNKSLQEQYKYGNKSLQEQLNLPLYSKILANDKSCNFFTNFDKLELFHKFHDIIAPLVRRRFRPISQTQTKRQFITTPNKWEKKRNYLQKMNLRKLKNDEIETWATNNGFSYQISCFRGKLL